MEHTGSEDGEMSEQRGDNVVYLRSERDGPGQQVAPRSGEHTEVLEGELVTDDEYRRLSERDKAVARWQCYRHDIVVTGRTLKTVATHQHTRTAGRTTGRHVAYVVCGVGVVAKRAWEAHTTSRYERMMRAAEASGDVDGVAEWEQRAEQAKERRHKRAMDWVKAPVQLAKALAVGLATVTALLLALGMLLAVGEGDPSLILAPINGLITAVTWTYIAVAAAWGPLVLAAPWVLLIALWWIGRHHSSVPSWLATPREARAETPIDERAIAHALQHLGIGPLKRFFKEGGQLMYTKVPARDGIGVAAQIRMPPEVAAADICSKDERVTRLASALQRASVEVWPSVGPDEGLLNLWIADAGGLNTPTPPWPWLDAGPVDFWQGVPLGIDLRGDPVIGPTDGASYLIGGRPGQGKSTFTRILTAGACLDPTAEIWVRVLADNADFESLSERLTRYSSGLSTTVIEQSCQDLHDLRDEMERRGNIMKTKLASTAREAGLHPIVAVFDEVHRGFQHRDLGKEFAHIAEDVIKQARKYGILVVFSTQSATATSIPKGITREVICRVAFSVIDQPANDALLGDGQHRRGVRATQLRPGTDEHPGDRGTCLTVGIVPGKDWAMLRQHNVRLPDAAEVGTRALQLLDEAGAQVPASQTETDKSAQRRDLLDDLAEVLSTERIRLADVPALLRDHAPDYGPYQDLTGVQLGTLLREAGVKTINPKNVPHVDPLTVQDALARRATEDLNEG